jgi:excisionase family DNA binding protein
MSVERWMTVSEVAAELGTHPETIRRWTRQRRHLPFTRIGDEARFEKADITAYLQSKRMEPVR